MPPQTLTLIYPNLTLMVVLDTPQMTGRPAQMMGFMDAVKNAIMNNYANFSGRASRSELWWFSLFNFLISIPVAMIDLIIGIEVVPGYGPFGSILIFALLLPNMGLVVRRLHDTGRSGWWYFIALVPCVGFIILLVFLIIDGEPHPNQYGDVPTNILPND